MIYSAAWGLSLGGTEFFLEIVTNSYSLHDLWNDRCELSGAQWSCFVGLKCEPRDWMRDVPIKRLNRTGARIFQLRFEGDRDRFENDLVIFKLHRDLLEDD
jgi:hypothetical protein